MMLVNQYKPRSIEDFKSNNKAAKKAYDFVKDYEGQTKKAILISGPPGTGKTELAYVLAKDLQLELLELNASDIRTADAIERILGNASRQRSLFYKGKLILVDDIDAISGVQDRGCIKALIDVLERSKYPFVITAIDPEVDFLDSLRKKCVLVKFDKLSIEELFVLLKKVCDEQAVSYSETTLRKLARYSQGDARAALNDLQSFIINGTLDIEGFEPRLYKEELEEMLLTLFKGGSFANSLTALNNLDVPLYPFGGRSLVIWGDMHIGVYWIEENVNKEFFDLGLGKAYELISLSDLFYGRIIKRQYWRYLVYSTALLAALSTLPKEKRGVVTYTGPSRSPKQNFRLWSLVNRKRTSISGKLSTFTHCSTKRALQTVLPYVRFMSKHDIDFSYDLGLEQDESDWLST